MYNIDFISEKWRTCRRTRTLAYIHLAASIFPILYVAVYAEAQRRDEDNKELGAALAALLFNVFQLMRTVMGLVQLNAFVGWCEHAVKCMKALQGKGNEGYVSSSSDAWSDRERISEIGLPRQKIFVSLCKRCSPRLRAFAWSGGVNGIQPGNKDGEDHEPPMNDNGNTVDSAEECTDALIRMNGQNKNGHRNMRTGGRESGIEASQHGNESNLKSIERTNRQETENTAEQLHQNTIMSCCKRGSVHADHREVARVSDIEDLVMVNNMVVDNELGGREVTVLHSWEKI